MQEAKDSKPHLTKNNKRDQNNQNLPIIPDKRYFTIGEMGFLCGVKPHVLRYWEQEFLHLKPIKRRSNRRYYQYNDVLAMRQVRKLLYEDGFTIEGAKAQLALSPEKFSKSVQTDAVVKKLIVDLETVLQKLAEDFS